MLRLVAVARSRPSVARACAVILLLLAGTCLAAKSVHAEPITVEFAGTVTEGNGPPPEFTGGPGGEDLAGRPFAGSYRIDPVPLFGIPLEPPGSAIDWRLATPGTLDVSVAWGLNFSAEFSDIRISNGVGSDSWQIGGVRAPDTSTLLSIAFTAPPDTMLESPAFFVNQELSGWVFSFVEARVTTRSGSSYGFRGTITSVMPLPEPARLSFLATALCLLAARRASTLHLHLGVSGARRRP